MTHAEEVFLEACTSHGIMHADYHYLLSKLQEFKDASKHSQVIVKPAGEKVIQFLYRMSPTSEMPFEGMRELLRGLTKRVGKAAASCIKHSVFGGQLLITIHLTAATAPV